MIDLMNKTSVSVELEGIAGKLKNIGDDPAANRVHQLAMAVKDGMYADAWAASNVHELIDAQSIVERYKRRPITDWLIALFEWIRNALIFAPLVVTWFYISKAVDAYSTLIGEVPDDIRQPFLYLWQRGFFGHLAGWQTLGWMATIDFGILITVLALTVLVYSLSNGLKRRREEEANSLGDRLAQALAGASLCLTTRKWKQPTNVMDGLKDIVDKFETRTDGLLKRIEALNTLQDSQLKTSVGFRGDLLRMFTDLKAGFDGLKSSNAALATNITGVNTSMNLTVGKLDALLKKADESLLLLRQEISEQGKVLAEQQSWGANLKVSIDKLGAAALAGEKMANEQGKVTLQLKAIIQEISDQQSKFVATTATQQTKQQTIEADFNAMVAHVQSVAREMHQCAVDMKGYTQDMTDLVRRAVAMIP